MLLKAISKRWLAAHRLPESIKEPHTEARNPHGWWRIGLRKS